MNTRILISVLGVAVCAASATAQESNRPSPAAGAVSVAGDEERGISVEQYRDKMAAGWIGQMARHAVDGYVRTPVSIYDLAPTIYAATGIRYPSEINGRKLKPMDGVNILPVLQGKSIADCNIRYAYKSDQVIRNEKFKLFGQRSRTGKGATWSLFDLSKDQSEIDNVIKEHREVAAEMIDDWNRFDADVGIVSGYDKYFGDKKDKAEFQK